MSRIALEKVLDATWSKAVRPLAAVTTLNPSLCRASVRSARTDGSSSTTRTVGVARPLEPGADGAVAASALLSADSGVPGDPWRPLRGNESDPDPDVFVSTTPFLR